MDALVQLKCFLQSIKAVSGNDEINPGQQLISCLSQRHAEHSIPNTPALNQRITHSHCAPKPLHRLRVWQISEQSSSLTLSDTSFEHSLLRNAKQEIMVATAVESSPISGLEKATNGRLMLNSRSSKA